MPSSTTRSETISLSTLRGEVHEGEERIRDAYPAATWDRLAEVKARYDPTNLFRLNQNIPPKAS